MWFHQVVRCLREVCCHLRLSATCAFPVGASRAFVSVAWRGLSPGGVSPCRAALHGVLDYSICARLNIHRGRAAWGGSQGDRGVLTAWVDGAQWSSDAISEVTLRARAVSGGIRLRELGFRPRFQAVGLGEQHADHLFRGAGHADWQCRAHRGMVWRWAAAVSTTGSIAGNSGAAGNGSTW